MPRFDFKCQRCDRIDEDVWVSVSPHAPNHHRKCPMCGDDMERLPAAPAFVVRGFNAANGYTRN